MVSGVADDNTYTLTGTVTGDKLHAIAHISGYTSTSDSVIASDGTTMTGTGTDSNGNTGTFTFVRQTPVPSASVAAAPSAAPSPGTGVNPPGVVPPNPAPGCTFGGFGSGSPPPATAADASLVAQIGSQAADKLVFPGGLAIDNSGGRDRLFIAGGTGAGELDVVDGLPRDPADLHVTKRLPVGHFPVALALDPDSGHAFVAVNADCRIAVVDGRAATPALLSSIDLPGNPESLAYDAAN